MTQFPTGRRVVLLDLDGTLVDPARGIIDSLRFALNALGRNAPEDLRWVIGPPIRGSLRTLLGEGGDVVEEALALYRARYGGQGLYEAALYDGIPDALAQIRDGGAGLMLCTSKVQAFALRILQHFGIASHFERVFGAEPDGRFDDKGDLIAHILETEQLRASRTIMVGDRKFDVLAAARHDIRTVGVLWGYGSEEELRRAGAASLCASPGDLAQQLRDRFGAP